LYGTHNYEFRQNFKFESFNNNEGAAPRMPKTDGEEIYSNRCKLYLNPESKFKKFWSGVLIFLMLYVATIMPYNIAFMDDEQNSV
jgi:hypothetical protein